MNTRPILDLLFPRLCGGCGGAVGDEADYLCWECRSQLLLIRSPYCRLCGDPIEGRVDDEFVCYFCSSTKIHFDAARSAARYDGVLRKVLRDFKYNKALWLTRDLVRLLQACYETHYADVGCDVVCAVPIHHARRRQREYNQALRLASGLASALGLPLLSGALAKTFSTQSQTNLTASQRATNVKGVFQARGVRRLGGRRVLLVDDVMTTGATANECARTLKQGGAAGVYVVTVARG